MGGAPERSGMLLKVRWWGVDATRRRTRSEVGLADAVDAAIWAALCIQGAVVSKGRKGRQEGADQKRREADSTQKSRCGKRRPKPEPRSGGLRQHTMRLWCSDVNILGCVLSLLLICTAWTRSAAMPASVNPLSSSLCPYPPLPPQSHASSSPRPSKQSPCPSA